MKILQSTDEKNWHESSSESQRMDQNKRNF